MTITPWFGRFGIGTGVGVTNVIRNLQIPNTRDGGLHPHKIDVFLPPTQTPVVSILALPGGGDTKEKFAGQLRLAGYRNGQYQPYNAMLDFWGVIVAVPQGQACVGNVTPMNPTGIDTRSDANPNGIACWSSYYMNSSYDDIQFMKDWSTYVTLTWGAGVGKTCFGHSAGAMMCRRAWYELYNKYSHFGAACGPVNQNYFDRVTYPLPASIMPCWMRVGDRDNILGIWAGPHDTDPEVSHWDDPKWIQWADNLSKADTSFPALGAHVPELQQISFQASQTFTDADGVINNIGDGVGTIWSTTDDTQHLELLQGATHDIATHQAITGTLLLNDYLKWIHAT